MLSIKDLDTFLKTIKAGRTTYLKVSTTTCGPCKMMEPVFKTLADKNENFDKVFAEVQLDVADNELSEYVSKTLGVRNVPTFLVYNRGELEINFSGAVPPSKLVSVLKL